MCKQTLGHSVHWLFATLLSCLPVSGMAVVEGPSADGKVASEKGEITSAEAETPPVFENSTYTVVHTEGDLEFKECPLSANHRRRYVQCAHLRVPEDDSQPEGAQIELLIVRLPSTAAQVSEDPVLAIAGGPGQAASRSFLRLDQAFQQLAQSRTIYLVDQRGTGQSNPQNCGLPDRQAPLLDPEPEQVAELARDCLQQFKGDPRQYTTEVAVQDLERVRRALKVPAWNLYGVSYGTRVAQTYMRRYPEVIRTATLDGVLPADVSLGPQIASHSQAALDALLGQCEADPACQDRFPKLDEQIDRLFAQLEQSPVPVRYESMRDGTWQEQAFTRTHLVSVIRMALYNSDVLSVLPPMIDAAARSDNFVALTRLAQRLDISDEIALGMHNSVVCTEDAPFYPESPDLALENTYMGAGWLSGLRALCADWPRGRLGEDFKAPLTSTIPTLLLSGERDPITPPAYGERLNSTLTNARHLVVPARGHHVGVQGCTPDIIARFVASADPTALDAGCLDRLRDVPLFLDPNGPSP